MGNQATVDIGSHGEAFNDINNPCRKDELIKSYDKLKRNVWPKYLQEIKILNKNGPVHFSTEKKTAERKIKEVFDKAADDMKNTRQSFKSLFKINDANETNRSNKQLYYMEMAIQKLQMMILSGDCTFYTDLKDIIQNLPDPLRKLVCTCYRQGCLMALHNPPLILAWNQKDTNPFPPIAEETEV